MRCDSWYQFDDQCSYYGIMWWLAFMVCIYRTKGWCTSWEGWHEISTCFSEQRAISNVWTVCFWNIPCNILKSPQTEGHWKPWKAKPYNNRHCCAAVRVANEPEWWLLWELHEKEKMELWTWALHLERPLVGDGSAVSDQWRSQISSSDTFVCHSPHLGSQVFISYKWKPKAKLNAQPDFAFALACS